MQERERVPDAERAAQLGALLRGPEEPEVHAASPDLHIRHAERAQIFARGRRRRIRAPRAAMESRDGGFDRTLDEAESVRPCVAREVRVVRGDGGDVEPLGGAQPVTAHHELGGAVDEIRREGARRVFYGRAAHERDAQFRIDRDGHRRVRRALDRGRRGAVLARAGDERDIPAARRQPLERERGHDGDTVHLGGIGVGAAEEAHRTARCARSVTDRPRSRYERVMVTGDFGRCALPSPYRSFACTRHGGARMHPCDRPSPVPEANAE